MTSSSIDDQISLDLARYAAVLERPRDAGLEEVMRGHQPARPGADARVAARRAAAISRSLDVWRPVYAHRVARMAAGLAACVAALGALAYLHGVGPLAAHGTAVRSLPVVLMVACPLAWWWAGRRFERDAAGRGATLGGDQVAALRARFAERAFALDGWSTGLALLGLGTMLPIGLHLMPCPDENAFIEYRGLGPVVFGRYLELLAALTPAVAWAVGRALHDARDGFPLPAWLRAFGSSAAAFAAAVSALSAAVVVWDIDQHPALQYGVGHQLGGAVVMYLGVMLPALWSLLWLRRRELAQAEAPRADAASVTARAAGRERVVEA